MGDGRRSAEGPRHLDDALRRHLRRRVAAFLARWRRKPSWLDLDDVCQEIEGKLIEARLLDKVDEARGSAKTLVSVFATSRLIEIQRREDGRLRLVEIDASAVPEGCMQSNPSPEAQAMSREHLAQVVECLRAELSREEWLVFLRIYQQGMSRAQVTKLEGISSGRFYRIHNKIRRISRAFVRRSER